jgi:hypothetical protein
MATKCVWGIGFRAECIVEADHKDDHDCNTCFGVGCFSPGKWGKVSGMHAQKVKDRIAVYHRALIRKWMVACVHHFIIIMCDNI